MRELRSRVRRALIPCGGKGTRMRSLTGGAAKELISVAGAPVLGRVARECASSGIDELLVVIAPGKEEIIEYLAPLAGLAGMPGRIDFIEQPVPRGLADAMRLGREFAAGEPLGVALPDNLFLDDAPGLAQVIDAYGGSSLNVVAVVEIAVEESARRGATSVLTGTVEGDLFRIERIPDKGTHAARFDTGGAASAFTSVGRYVLESDAFEAIDELEGGLGPGRELDDIPMMQRLLARGRLVGRRIRGRFLDVGLPDGWREAERELSRAG